MPSFENPASASSEENDKDKDAPKKQVIDPKTGLVESEEDYTALQEERRENRNNP